MHEELVTTATNGSQLIWRAGDKKPQLTSLSIPQWSVANVSIMTKLQGEGKLAGEDMLDYLSYTTRIYQLMQHYEIASVMVYDREYRRLQSQLNFRWGTEINHLQIMWLKEQAPRNYVNKHSDARPNSGKDKSGPLTADGKVICKKYNSKGGCAFRDCKFVHACSKAGCAQSHSASTHVSTDSKNT